MEQSKPTSETPFEQACKHQHQETRPMANPDQTPTERGFDEGHERKAFAFFFQYYDEAQIDSLFPEYQAGSEQPWRDSKHRIDRIAQLIADTERARDEYWQAKLIDAVDNERFSYPKEDSGDTTEVVRYLCDDRDSGDRNELVIMQGGNGDWYVGVAPEGEGYFRKCVRICTSGGAQFAASGLAIAISYAYRAIKCGDAWKARSLNQQNP